MNEFANQQSLNMGSNCNHPDCWDFKARRLIMRASRSRSGAYDTHVWLTFGELLREPYITDEIRSYIAQLQN